MSRISTFRLSVFLVVDGGEAVVLPGQAKGAARCSRQFASDRTAAGAFMHVDVSQSQSSFLMVA